MKIRKILKNSEFKAIILSILPIIYTILFDRVETIKAENKNLSIFVAVLLLAIHIIIAVVYIIKDKKEDRDLSKIVLYEKQLKVIKRSNRRIDTIINEGADLLYTTIKDQRKTEHSIIKDWRLIERLCDRLCDYAHEMVKEIAEKGEDFSVSIWFKKTENNENGYTMISRASDDNGYTPAAYRGFISHNKADGYYFKQIFEMNPTAPQILEDKDTIENNFKDCKRVNYSQYIAIPISCKGNNVIGIFQIVAYNDSVIAKDKNDLEKLCYDFFSSYCHLALLSDKIENIEQLIKGDSDGLDRKTKKKRRNV